MVNLNDIFMEISHNPQTDELTDGHGMAMDLPLDDGHTDTNSVMDS